MSMEVSFTYIGLEFQATVDYEPLVPAQLYGPPENCYPAEGGYAEITELSCDGKDASFLLRSNLSEELSEAAYEACVEEEASCREEAEEARADARKEDLWP